MTRTFRIGLLLVAALVLAGAPAARAMCTFESQQIWHGLDGSFVGCPDAQPVLAYTYALSSPATINSAGQAVACNDASVTLPTGLPCLPASGVPGDGVVTVYYEWGNGNPGSAGCPNPDQIGEDPLGLQLVCNDGSSILVTVGYADTDGSGNLPQQYLLELAGPADGTPIPAGFQNGPVLTTAASGATDVQACVNVPDPFAWSDCDPTSFAVANGVPSCPTPGSRPAFTRGKLYTRTAPCGSSPDPRVASGWTLAAVQPDLDGNACNVLQRPAATTDCSFLGATATLGATETAAIVGSLRITGDAAANDKVKIDNAAFAQGKVIVAFSTTNETSIVGFNVYSGATKLNGNLITAKGAGSNAYNFEVGRGVMKGGKTVLVEAVKSDGSVEKTAPVSLK